MSTKTNIRQIDIMSLENKIVIEFDGIHHFKDVFKKKGNLNEVSKKDQELNSVLVEEGWTVIRVSHDEYDYKENGKFKQETLDKIFEIVSERRRGLWQFGSSYV